ncbi:MAG: M12 family metallo-peptidase, partial [Bacteroidota bacterium]
MKNLFQKKIRIPFLLVLVFPFCSTTTFSQVSLFQEEVTNFTFSAQEEELRKTYDALDIRFVKFAGLPQSNLADLELEVNLFGTTKHRVAYLRTDVFTNNTTSWVGKIEKQPYSSVVFSEYEGTWAGRIQDNSGNRYLLVATDQADAYALVELGDKVINEGNDAVIRPEAKLRDEKATSRSAMSICDIGSTCASKTVDILIVYTAAVIANQGGTNAVLATFANIISDMNTINTNSAVNHTFNLIATHETNYVETTSPYTDLDWLEADETVSALRAAHGADIVGLITNTPTNQYCGLGNLNISSTNYSSNAAFSVTAWSCASGNRTFAHEVGHNMGLRHDRFVDINNSPCVHAHGYVNQAAFGSSDVSKRWRTVMAYNSNCSANGFNCSRIGYWSNPNVTNTGDPMGSTTLGAEADAAYLLNRAICQVADFRSTPTCPAVSAVDVNDLVCSGSLGSEISNWQTNVNNGSVNLAAIASANTNNVVEYSTVLVQGAVTAPNGNTANGVHSGGSNLTETQTTYAYLRCFGADQTDGTGDDSYLLLGTHTLTVDSEATGTGNGVSTVNISDCSNTQNINLTTNTSELAEDGVVGWWVTETNPITTTVTDNASLATALNNVTIGGALSNTVNNLYESTSGMPKKEYMLPFDCSPLDDSKTYYATPVLATSKSGQPASSCSNSENSSPINVNFGGGDLRAGARTGLVDLAGQGCPTDQGTPTWQICIDITTYTNGSGNLAFNFRQDVCSNSNFVKYDSKTGVTAGDQFCYTVADIGGFDPTSNSMCVLLWDDVANSSNNNVTLSASLTITANYAAVPAIPFPSITSYDDCLFGTPVQINCNCPGSCPTIGTLAGTSPLCSGDTVTSLVASGLANMGGNDVKFVYFNSAQTGNAMYGTPAGTLGTVTNANLGGSGTTATLTNVHYPTAPGTYYVYAILGTTPTDANCR